MLPACKRKSHRLANLSTNLSEYGSSLKVGGGDSAVDWYRRDEVCHFEAGFRFANCEVLFTLSSSALELRHP
jgi:hypothetical protein